MLKHEPGAVVVVVKASKYITGQVTTLTKLCRPNPEFTTERTKTLLSEPWWELETPLKGWYRPITMAPQSRLQVIAPPKQPITVSKKDEVPA